MKEILLGIWLIIEGAIDIKWKKIPLWLFLASGGIGVIFCFLEQRAITSILLACILGLLLIGVSRITNEVIGYGDGITFLVMGIYLPLSQLLEIGMMAFCVAGIAALVLLVIFKKKGSYRIPFIPFLVIAYGIEILIRYGESWG
jgi:leader peptidase (prepilin peptidase)/N-methyltransferase